MLGQRKSPAEAGLSSNEYSVAIEAVIGPARNRKHRAGPGPIRALASHVRVNSPKRRVRRSASDRGACRSGNPKRPAFERTGPCSYRYHFGCRSAVASVCRSYPDRVAWASPCCRYPGPESSIGPRWMGPHPAQTRALKSQARARMPLSRPKAWPYFPLSGLEGWIVRERTSQQAKRPSCGSTPSRTKSPASAGLFSR
jgi:hypothetical protein